MVTDTDDDSYIPSKRTRANFWPPGGAPGSPPSSPGFETGGDGGDDGGGGGGNDDTDPPTDIPMTDQTDDDLYEVRGFYFISDYVLHSSSIIIISSYYSFSELLLINIFL